MDHNFNDRVDKVFASISSSSSSTPWSLTDAQVERRVWNRDKSDNRDDDDETLVSSSFDNLFNGRRNRRKSLDDFSDGDEDVGGDDGVRTEDDGDEWDIRSSIGLDSTLDNEEEEDAYDKMAEGRENGGERLYMKDVTEYGSYLNSHNVLPSDAAAKKDSRDAAKTRLKDDDDDEPMLNAEEASGYDMRIKSILKRKNDDDEDAVKPAKRVRFDPNCKKNGDEIRNSIPPPPQQEGFGSVPDYVLNPSKYTRYDLFDEEGSKSEREAYLDDQIKVFKDKDVDRSSSSPSVVFIPRKKRGDDGEASSKQVKQPSTKDIVSIAALEQQQQQQAAEISQEMHVCSNKPGRRYRSRMEQDDTDS